ncbi:thiamine phosphate synthase [Winogradskya humida]|uniref:Thiamine-phosphate synthase n=1 Tax=Winogradskya humida TaxID=113566 RepID=A0ABQ3ZKK4_9ACTN|nr:thiamine phosphate synthase [Actinoplanes humidus]GIE19130.1 putative thiamine-phosphate synthase [Actinoplanes humidus]
MVIPSGVVVLTDRRLAAGPLVETVKQTFAHGASWVILREKDLPYAQRSALASQLRTVAPGRVIVAGPDALGGNAVHLAATDSCEQRVELVGRSWHGTEALSDEDYVSLSPVFPTASKPGYGPALGAAGAAALAGPRPWLALGGIDSAARAAECMAAGAAGVAVMGAVMRDPALARSLAAVAG